MIHDKDYMMRQVKQFSEFISKMLLGKNEGTPTEEQLVVETSMKNVFKKSFEELSAMSTEDINGWVGEKEDVHQVAYYVLLGHLFYHKFKEDGNRDFAEKAKTFYETWLQKSQIFSLPVIGRSNELK